MKALIFILTLMLFLASCSTQEQVTTSRGTNVVEIGSEGQDSYTINAEIYENGLSPRTINIPSNEDITLQLFNNMDTIRLEIEEYNIAEELPPREQYEINFNSNRVGNFRILVNDVEMGILSVN